MTAPTPVPGRAAAGATPAAARTQLHADAERLADLYPVRHRPVAAAWHPSCIHVPASVRALVEGMPPYGT